jgi:hypothetical protein
VVAVSRPDVDHAEHLVPSSGIMSPALQFGTALLSVGGSAGVPSSRSSLKVKVIQSSYPGPDGRTERISSSVVGTCAPALMAALVGLLLTAAAIALAWLLYRLERLHARHRDLDGALAVIRGVKRGMVERVGDDVGWAEHFFTTIYTRASDDPEVEWRVKDTYNSAYEGDPFQVFPVPPAPLEFLVSSAATVGFVSDDTVFSANHGLWRIAIFNEFVRIQADYNARFLAELQDPNLPEARRRAIADGAVWITRMLHAFGIDEASVDKPGRVGWYVRLKRALEADITRLTADRERGFFDYGDSRKWFLLGDLGMAALVAAFALTVLIGAICDY